MPVAVSAFQTLDELLSSRLDSAFNQKRYDLSASPEEKALPPPKLFVKRSKSLCSTLLDVTHEWSKNETEKLQGSSQLRPLLEILTDPIANQAYQALSTGAEIVNQIRIDANGFAKTPTDFQRELIDFLTQLLGRRIFGLEWKINQVDIRRRLGWKDETHGIGGIMTGRKEGKSTGLSMGASLALLNIPGVEVALFSKTRAQAQIILNMAKVAVGSHLRRNEFKIEASANCLKLTNLADRNDIRVCTAYSGNADVSRDRARAVCVRLGVVLFFWDEGKKHSQQRYVLSWVLLYTLVSATGFIVYTEEATLLLICGCGAEPGNGQARPVPSRRGRVPTFEHRVERAHWPPPRPCEQRPA